MFRTQYLSIKKKLTMIIMTSTLLTVVLLSSVFIAYEYVSLRNNMVKEFSTTSKIIANRSHAAILFNDTVALQENVDSLSIHDDIETTCIYSESDDILASFDKTQQDSPQKNTSSTGCPDHPSRNLSHFNEGYYQLSQPIVLDGETVGLLFVRVSLNNLNTHLSTYVIATGVFSLLVILAVFIISSFLQNYITTPLTLLKDTARQVTNKKDYSLRATKESYDEIGDLVDAFNTMLSTIQEQNHVITENSEGLELKVNERTKELAMANKELEAFSYSVSHDLRAPLRAIDGFSKALLEDFGAELEPTAHDYLKRVRAASQKMGVLISSLLQLSRVTRKQIKDTHFDLTDMVNHAFYQLQQQEPDRIINIKVQPEMYIMGDPQLIEVAIDNLIGNAWKYTKYEKLPRIEVGYYVENGHTIYFIKDNGAGFDERYATNLFTAFQRLHSPEQFDGTGIGLATVYRIIHRHHGDIWAKSTLGEGATFYFTLHDNRPPEDEVISYRSGHNPDQSAPKK
ncbi:ATP-binding protein [Alkalimarinus alittae]|uniref:histidine kinase n=1 Tax=Alkalimarinus alittae TaxID=2961619 RepID=A0ABY6N4T3_9ALTE|nr:ATP-binding protein [Alkalimarinus alittae]UZE97130.1 ATP-binding protein [Alkalimarinus alittae]